MSSKPHAFDPGEWSESAALQSEVSSRLACNDLEGAIRVAFSLPTPDAYVYRAVAAVTLSQAQRAVSLGRANGLHRWYLKQPASSTAAAGAGPPSSSSTPRPTAEENDLGSPPAYDVSAYASLFSAGAAPAKALSALSANAKGGSLRAQVAAHLLSKRLLDVEALGGSPSRTKGPHFNPALDFWAWSCASLEWGGPCEAATRSHVAHPCLPVFMHHFGCVAPSFEALELVRLVVERRQRRIALAEARDDQKEEQEQEDEEENAPAAPEAEDAGTRGVAGGSAGDGVGEKEKEEQNDKKKKKRRKKKKGSKEPPPVAVLDVGSGNGYWTYMLRRHGLRVHAVDSGQSLFRVSWIDDTAAEDGARWLKKHFSPKNNNNNGGGSRGGGIANLDVLLLVYPVVGADFTRAMLAEYRGRDVVVAGTQNRNGYTAFSDRTVDEFMAAEHADWRRLAQVPLPSFAGKDEALFVFSKD